MVRNHPEIARVMVDIHRRYRNVTDKLSLATESRNFGAADQSTSGAQTLTMPHEEVRDFFYARQNYIDSVDTAAEELALTLSLSEEDTDVVAVLERRLRQGHGVAVSLHSELGDTQHYLDPRTKTLQLARHLSPVSAPSAWPQSWAFWSRAIRSPLRWTPGISCPRRPGSWLSAAWPPTYAAALILPYQAFHTAAETQRYDIELLSQCYGVGYETICHRLSTMQRPSLRGIPWTFVRVKGRKYV